MLLGFWQLLSWLLPLLSYNYQHVPTVRGAFRTFIMQRAGDAAFLAAVVLAHGWYGTLDLQQLFMRAAADKNIVSLWPTGIEIHAATAVTLLIFIGAMAKSAQFPLHMWLPDSLYAPTPVHALLHAGIVNAGGFLLTLIGMAMLLAFGGVDSPPVAALPGLIIIGFGVGGMLTPSVNVVQSALADERQGEISGLSRSVSNLGSSFGTAIGGTVLALAVAAGNKSYALALLALGAFGVLGLLAAFFLPTSKAPKTAAAANPRRAHPREHPRPTA
jgi:predicted MFS family arabinose efflux permease